MRRRREIEMEDRDVEEIVDGEFMRLGVSLTSRFREWLNRRIKEGIREGVVGREREDRLEAKPPKWSVKEHFEAAFRRIVICNSHPRTRRYVIYTSFTSILFLRF